MDATLPATRRSRKSTTGLSPSRKAMDKENATVDVANTLAASRKKSRSKSIGPGGLDALKSGTGNRRVSLAAPSRPPPRSILKPTIPLLPEIPPHKPKGKAVEKVQSPSPSDDSGSGGKKIALRTEEEQQAAAREREARERAQLEKEVNDRREARRKSLANRRVSFAAEATLHTFHEVEFMQDSTTSTDSTRRASSTSAASTPRTSQEHPGSDASEPPSTPPEQADETVPESPADQRRLHQKKRRRSSGVPTLNFHNADDDTMTSTVYDSDSDHGDSIAEVQTEETSDSSSDSDDDGTLMTVEAEEMTSASVASARSESSMDTTSNLDEALRLANQRASTQNGHDDDEGLEMVPGLIGWGKKNFNQQSNHGEDNTTRLSDRGEEEETEMEMDMDMEMTKPMGGIIRSKIASPEKDESDDMSMDVTRVLGGIIPQKSGNLAERAAGSSPSQDQTMDFTMAIGGIHSTHHQSPDEMDHESNEDMSMELTTIIGGVLSKPNRRRSRQSISPMKNQDAEDDAPMDMTVGVGRIMGQVDEAEAGDDTTVGMDMTMVVGGILKPTSPGQARSVAKKLMEEEANQPDPSPMTTNTSDVTQRISPSKAQKARAVQSPSRDSTESPGLSAFRGKGLRRSSGIGLSSAPKSPAKSPGTPVSKAPTPSGKASSAITTKESPRHPLPGAKRTPSPSRRSTSPQSKSISRASKSPAKGSTVFQHNPSTGVSTPKVVLTPQRRRLSGVGADRSGLGSPRVTDIFDRRESIGDTASDFVPGQMRENRRAVTFEDPRIMQEELDRERQDAEDLESGRKILEREADGSQDDKEVTLNLKEMIENLSPKKSVLKGRKSLHVGSARGLLGKRPAELDDEEDAEERDGVKRLKGHQGSPVKNVRLQQPPSKAETTARMTRSARRTLDRADGNIATPTTSESPIKGSGGVATPKNQGRFRNIDEDQPSMTMDFDATRTFNEIELQANDNEDRIHLQDFLNMTSIRFMELTTTKRRHTVAPTAPKDNASGEDKDDISLERCVVAGACTVPMLELYQHSCRELKKYISEGRRIVREIETETLEENPPLFREYISASPEFKILMDNQFKNVKTHARLLSKAMWYEWRMKLQDGLREGLLKIAEGMEMDEKLIEKQQKLLSSVAPALIKQFETLEREHEHLESFASELADCDPEELQSARAELESADKDIETKMLKIAELRDQLQDTEVNISKLAEQKQHCQVEIKEAEKVREECRGWSSNEISSLKVRVDELENQHGWAITGVVGTTISVTYLREIELVFDIASFQPGQPNSRIDLWYIAANRERNPLPATTEKEFFLQCLRDYVRALPQSSTKLSRILGTVRAAWNQANAVANHIHLLNLTFPTRVTKTSDSSIAIQSSLLLVPLSTKVEIVLNLHCSVGADGLDVTVMPQANAVYGEQFNAPKMTEFLSTRIGHHVLLQEEKQSESWSDVVVELQTRLLARGKK